MVKLSMFSPFRFIVMDFKRLIPVWILKLFFWQILHILVHSHCRNYLQNNSANLVFSYHLIPYPNMVWNRTAITLSQLLYYMGWNRLLKLLLPFPYTICTDLLMAVSGVSSGQSAILSGLCLNSEHHK